LIGHFYLNQTTAGLHLVVLYAIVSAYDTAAFWAKIDRTILGERTIIWLAGVRRVGKTVLCQSLPDIEYFDSLGTFAVVGDKPPFRQQPEW